MRTDLPTAMAELVAGVTRVRVIDGGVFGGRALGDRVLGEFVGEDASQLLALLRVEQPTDAHHCLCLGHPAIELWVDGTVRATLGVHHGSSLRVADWWSDAPLRDGEALLRWLADHDITGPLAALLAAERSSERALSRRESWLSAAPAALRPRLAELECGLMHDVRDAVAALRDALAADAAAALLRWYGSTGGPWHGFPTYETTAESLLSELPIGELLAAGDCDDSDVLLGLARFLCRRDAPAHQRTLIDEPLRRRLLASPRVRADVDMRDCVSALLHVSIAPDNDGVRIGESEYGGLSRPVACAGAWAAVDGEFVVRFDPGRTLGTVRASVGSEAVALGVAGDDLVVALTTTGEVQRIPILGGDSRTIAARQARPGDPTGLRGLAVWLEQPRLPGGRVGTRLRMEGASAPLAEHPGSARDLVVCGGALWWIRGDDAAPESSHPASPVLELMQWEPERERLQVAATLERAADDRSRRRLSSDGEQLAWTSGRRVGLFDPRSRWWTWFDVDADVLAARPHAGGLLVALARGYRGELGRIGSDRAFTVLARWDRTPDDCEQLAVCDEQVAWTTDGQLWAVSLDPAQVEARAAIVPPRPVAKNERPAASAPPEEVLFVCEGVRCSRKDVPEGRLLLAVDGLYFIPGVAPASATSLGGADPWLGGALIDDDDAGRPDYGYVALRSQPPRAQLAAIPGSLHYPPGALGTLDIADLGWHVETLPDGPTFTRRLADPWPSTITLTFADGREPLCFTLPTYPYDALRRWSERMGQPTRR